MNKRKTGNGRYVYESKNDIHPILPPDRLPSTGVLPGHVWLKQALDSRKFLHVTWLNIYRREFIMQHRFHFEPGLRHQDIPWTTEALLAAALQCAQEIAAKPPVAIWGSKQAIHYARDHAVDDSLRQMGWLQGAIWSSANVRESILAMQAKRAPQFDPLAPLKSFRELG